MDGPFSAKRKVSTEAGQLQLYGFRFFRISGTADPDILID
jgi:hypothetical protein